MALTEYKRKRDFSKTAEPAGKPLPKKVKGASRFVIQKHDASRLHYDFRLEMDGVLKSWAVPKGLPWGKGEKHLAVEVEDHPVDYATFEGVIPQGEYGGGTVMVWDRGTWEPEIDPAKGFRQGKLKFSLHGEKLQGSWALVRMGGRAGDDGKNWLLIKHRDDQAKPLAKLDITKREPRSVLTGRDMDQIASDADAVWKSNCKASQKAKAKAAAKKSTSKARSTKKTPKSSRNGRSPVTAKDLAKLDGARRVSFPHDFKPQLATLTNRVPATDNWL